MSEVLEQIVSKSHQQVSVFQDRATGLVSLIAVHDTTLGPALGGCRMRQYPALADALQDVLNLSEAMSYKNSLAGLRLGGGKSVIINDPNLESGRAELFRQFGRCVESLGGSYITAEDMGTSVKDMMWIAETTKHVAGRDPNKGGAGDPSPWTAEGVFGGIQACLERVFGSSDPRGRKIAIQGIGHVGTYLAKLLHEAGAELTVCDPNAERCRAISTEFNARVVGLEEIFSVPCELFAPCAAGGAINVSTVAQLQCQIVAGAANNQVSSLEAEQLLAERGIVYAPDFAINAGGVILCAEEFEPGGYTVSRVRERVSQIRSTVGRILDESKKTGELSGLVAVRLAKERISNARK